MPTVHSKALNRSLEIERIVGHLRGRPGGPTVVFTAGMHGNEPAGLFALDRVLAEISESRIPIFGNVYALSGNLTALAEGKRYHRQDLNRLWTKENVSGLMSGGQHSEEDLIQQLELFRVVDEILKSAQPPFLFIDLHTTSAETIPFITVNDSLRNRHFIAQYPVPIILGIEEYLQGPFLSYINDMGHAAFGYEGGQHDDMSAIENHVSFIMVSLVIAGVIDRGDIAYDHHIELLAKNTLGEQHIYEILFRYEVGEGEQFDMKPGFVNFEKIKQGQEMAVSNGIVVTSKHSGQVLMPRYQPQGNDGFFIIRRLSRTFLELSSWIRKMRLDRGLAWLPGVHWASGDRDALVVNRKVARLFSIQLFHLFGYRIVGKDRTHLIVKNRDSTELA